MKPRRREGWSLPRTLLDSACRDLRFARAALEAGDTWHAWRPLMRASHNLGEALLARTWRGEFINGSYIRVSRVLDAAMDRFADQIGRYAVGKCALCNVALSGYDRVEFAGRPAHTACAFEQESARLRMAVSS